MEQLPTQPAILASTINMLLRDNEYDSLEDLCAAFGRDKSELLTTLSAAGFEYLPDQKRFF